MQGACTGRRRNLRNELITVADVDVFFPGDFVKILAKGIFRDLNINQVVLAARQNGGRNLGAGTVLADGRAWVGVVEGVWCETSFAEAVVAINRSETGLILHTHQRAFQAGFLTVHGVARVGGDNRVVGQDLLLGGVGQRVTVHVSSGAAHGLLPRFGDVGVEVLTLGVGTIQVELVAASGITAGIACEAFGWLIQLDVDARNTGLPVLHRGVLRVEFVAGGVVADGADDAAVAGIDAVRCAGWVIGVHAPVQLPGEADDGQRADVNATADELAGCITLNGNGCRDRLVVGLKGGPRGVIAIVVGLHHQPLRHGVGTLELVVTGAVGFHRGGTAIHERVLSLAHGKSEVGHAWFARVFHTVAVGIAEDVTIEKRPPAVDRNNAHVDGFAVADGDVLQVEDVVLRLVPPGQRVVAVGNVRDVEGTVDVALADPHRGVAVGEVGERKPWLGDGVIDLGTAKAAEDLAGCLGGATGRGHVHMNTVNNALDVPGTRSHCVGLLHEAEHNARERLAALDEFGVKAGGAFHHPGVPVVVTFKGGGLDPRVLACAQCGWNDLQRVAVRSKVGD